MKIPTSILAAAFLSSMSFLHAADESTYPLKTCIVSGEALDDMGKPFVFTYEGEEVQLCCKNCQAKFDKDPAAYMKKIEAAKTEPAASASPAAEAHGDHQH